MRVFCAVLIWLLWPLSSAAQRPPIIDMHLHGYSGELPGAPPAWAAERARGIRGAADGEAHRDSTLAVLDRYNVVLAAVSGPEASLRAWKEAAGERVLGGAFLGRDGLPEHSVEELRALHAEGVVSILGELGLQYQGMAPDDPRMGPYYALAEELGMPVALHTGLGPPGGPHTFAPRFRTTLGRPSLMEPVLARHPDLKVYLMHAGWPYLNETIALLYVYPELYVDVGVVAWALPEAVFHRTLRRLLDAGFEDRILFGTDQMTWPEAVAMAIETVESAPYLSEVQKRKIFYDNAAAFLELDDAEIARHHGRAR